MGLGLVGIIGIVALAIVALPLLAGAVLVILVVSNRADPDPTGRRPAVVYSFAVSFVTLFVTLFSTFVIVAKLWSLIGSHHTSPGIDDVNSLFSDGTGVRPPAAQHPYGDSVARAVVIALLLALVAGFVYLKHVRAGERATAGVRLADPAGRVRSSYVAAVSFVCVVVATISTVVAAYQVFRIIGPGVFNADGSGSRVAALRVLLPLVYLAGASLFLLRRHVQQLPPGARPFFSLHSDDPVAGGAEDAVADEVVAVEVEVLDAGPPPRKRAPRKTAPPKE
jgi:hypothetical protein